MRIEEISKEGLEKIQKKELHSLRLRFRQLWDKHFDDNEDIVVGSLDRNSFLKQYCLLVKEARSREMKLPTTNIDRALFSKAMTKRKIKIEKPKKPKKEVEKQLVIIPLSKEEDEHLVSGIVYEPDVPDLQGDVMNEEEIQKAAYLFMEKSQAFDVSHKGSKINVKILENYLAPQDIVIEGRAITKGTWLLTLRILNKEVWEKIKDGDLQGYSMAGTGTATYLE